MTFTHRYYDIKPEIIFIGDVVFDHLGSNIYFEVNEQRKFEDEKDLVVGTTMDQHMTQQYVKISLFSYLSTLSLYLSNWSPCP